MTDFTAPTSGFEDEGDWRPVLTEMIAAMNRYGHEVGDGDIPSDHRSLMWRAEQLLAKPASEPAGGDVVRRLHCDHCSARFNTEWERVEHERERHAAPYAWVVMGSSALCGEHVITTSEEVRDRWAANPSVQIVALYTTPPAALSSSAGPAVEAVAWRLIDSEGDHWWGPSCSKEQFDKAAHENPDLIGQPLYAHPAPATVDSDGILRLARRLFISANMMDGNPLFPRGEAREDLKNDLRNAADVLAALAPATEGRKG